MKTAIVFCMGISVLGAYAAGEPMKWFGALQTTPERAKQGAEAGWNVAVISVAWDAFEPKPGQFDSNVIRSLQERIRTFRSLGYQLQLDLGLQYPPEWVLSLPGARYRNQFGAEYASDEPGRRMVNAVFNEAIRERIRSYLGGVFGQLGHDWDWVRLGGGFYGEVNFPPSEFAGNKNSYWAFDDRAQGKQGGLPAGVAPCPVPGWMPGTNTNPNDTRQFLDWYLGALQNYHDWQIRTLREWFSGDLCMLYGSWGIRPGGIEAAVQTNLDGSSPAEKVGEISTGYDWARMIGGIQDPRVLVYCTWIDAPPKDCDDHGDNPVRWSPVHWQASLARANPLKLRVWGENTGRNDLVAMQVSFARAREFGLIGLLWAFEGDLFAEPARGFATFADLSKMIQPGKANSPTMP